MSFSVADHEVLEPLEFKPLKNGTHDMTVIEAKHEAKNGRKTIKLTWQESSGKGRAWSSHIYDDEMQPEWLKTSRTILADCLWCFGVKGFKDDEDAAKMCQWLIGQSIWVRTKQETYDGKINVKAVGFYNKEKTNRAGFLAKDVIGPTSEEDIPW